MDGRSYVRSPKNFNFWRFAGISLCKHESMFEISKYPTSQLGITHETNQYNWHTIQHRNSALVHGNFKINYLGKKVLKNIGERKRCIRLNGTQCNISTHRITLWAPGTPFLRFHINMRLQNWLIYIPKTIGWSYPGEFYWQVATAIFSFTLGNT